MKKQTSPLLKSVKEFLVESLENYKLKRLNFSIIHAIIATELLLKERLVRVHPNLVYTNIDLKDLTKGDTLSLSKLPQRLINLGINISDSGTSLIRNVANWRNEIVHHMPNYEERKAVTELGKLYDFLVAFLRDELKLDIRNIIPKSLFPLLNEILKEWQVLVREAKEKAAIEGEINLVEECPVCWLIGTVSKRKRNQAYCHLCKTKLVYAPCDFCGNLTLDTYPYIPQRGAHHARCIEEVMREMENHEK